MGACTRILLFVFTFLLLVGSALLIAGGVVLYINEKNYNFPTASALGVSFSLSNILQAVMGIGSYIALTSLFGCCGALTRKGGLLKGFIVLLVIDIIVIAGGGGYLLYKMVQNNNGINQLTYDNYYSYGNGTWLVFQSACKISFSVEMT